MNESSWKKQFAAYAALQNDALAQKMKNTIMMNEGKVAKHGKVALRQGRLSLLVAVFLLLFGGSALAVTFLHHPQYKTWQYFSTIPENREVIADVSKAIEGADAQIESFAVQLLGEYSGGYNDYEESDNIGIPSERIQFGFPAWNPDEFVFLRDIKPEKCEVYYDGSRLYVCTGLRTSNPYRFLGPRIDLDISMGDFSVEVNGKNCTEYIRSNGWGSGIISARGKTEQELKKQEEVWVIAEFDQLSAPLEDGICRMTMQYNIYDAAIDDMASIGNIARVIVTIAFDTREGNKDSATITLTEMSGDVVLTVLEHDDEGECYRVNNRTVSLDGMKLLVQTQYSQSGAVIKIKATSLPEGWDESMLNSFFYGLGSGIGFEAYVNGDSVISTMLSSAIDEYRIELPILPSDHAEIRDIRLVPYLSYLKFIYQSTEAKDHQAAKEERQELLIDAEPLSGHFMGDSSDAIRQELPGCEIVLPLPKDR